jgi:hypothetical protein
MPSALVTLFELFSFHKSPELSQLPSGNGEDGIDNYNGGFIHN